MLNVNIQVSLKDFRPGWIDGCYLEFKPVSAKNDLPKIAEYASSSEEWNKKSPEEKSKDIAEMEVLFLRNFVKGKVMGDNGKIVDATEADVAVLVDDGPLFNSLVTDFLGKQKQPSSAV